MSRHTSICSAQRAAEQRLNLSYNSTGLEKKHCWPKDLFPFDSPCCFNLQLGEAMLTFLKSHINLFDHFFVFLHKLLIKQIHTSKLNNYIISKRNKKYFHKHRHQKTFLDPKTNASATVIYD